MRLELSPLSLSIVCVRQVLLHKRPIKQDSSDGWGANAADKPPSSKL